MIQNKKTGTNKIWKSVITNSTKPIFTVDLPIKKATTFRDG